MKASTQYNLLFLGGAIVGYVGLFHTTLGLPDWVQVPCMLVFGICVWSVVWLQRRARRRGDPTISTPTSDQRRRRTWLLLIVVFLSSVMSPFAVPYMGVTTLSFGVRVIIAAVTFVICAAIVLIAAKGREKA